MKGVILLVLGAWAVAAEQRAIDTQKSSIRVHVSRSGVFSAFGHDHDIAAPIARGTADPAAHKVELHVQAAALKVRDSKVSDKDRAEIQKTMLGPEVLDVARHPEIAFRSTSAEAAGAGGWKLQGTLTLHGETKPVVVQVSEKGGHYVGHAVLRQTDFGIKPVKVAGGTVKVKDELRIEFDIQLAH